MPSPPSTTNSATPIIPFQLGNYSIQQKSDFEFGKQLAQDIESKVYGGTSSYFWIRNQRWKINRNYIGGRVSMQKFMDMLGFNGKQNYANLNWQCIHIVNRIVTGLVGRWMTTRNEKIQVKATDSLSTKQKQDEFEQLEFYIENRRMIEQLQQQSGVQILPEELPENKDELKLWQSQFQRLPEEVLYEIGINDLLAAEGWFGVLKEKSLHDGAATCFAGTYTWMDEEGVVHVEWLKPENCFYSYSDYPDFRDTSWRGYVRTMKISELRKKYGAEFGGKLSEEDLFEMARTAKEYRLYDNLSWAAEWNVTLLRPYDEWNIDVLEFELRTVDSESYTIVTTKKNGSTIIKKGKPKKKGDNEEVIEDSRINIYRGVYAKTTQKMLEWGLKKNMIRPQDPKEIGNAEFSYSFYMAQNYDMTSMAIPEKIQEPVEQMILSRLKIQQLVMKMRPSGTAVNWTAVQNIDYGMGENNKSIDFKKMFDQTGDFYYHDKDAEGNPIGVPFTEIPNAGFLPQLQGLILLYDKHYQILKDELGEDPNLITQAAQPRVAVQNIETSQQTAAFSTDYIYDIYKYVIEDTARKVSCLLKNSVTYGAKVYRNIVKEGDVEGRIFSTRVSMLPNDFEIQRFEAMMNQAMAANPDFVSFIDPFQLMRVAKEDVKLAELLFRQSQKKMLTWQRQTAKENQDQTIQGQIQAAQAAEQEKGKNMEMELELKGAIAEGQGKIDKEKIALTGVWNFINTYYAPQKSGGENGSVKQPKLPKEVEEFVTLTLKNTAIPLAMDNAQMVTQATQPQQEIPEQQNPDQIAA